MTELCLSCNEEIDPDVCWCGTEKENHNSWNAGHTFVEMGCVCYYSN